MSLTVTLVKSKYCEMLYLCDKYYSECNAFICGNMVGAMIFMLTNLCLTQKEEYHMFSYIYNR